MKSKTIQITAGRGPAECTWVVAQVLKTFIKEALATGLQYEVLHREPGNENGTLQSASISLSGKGLDAFLPDWLGTIQWIGQSQFRKQHKRKNWFIALYLVEDLVEGTVLRDNEIRYQTSRAGGPGGQHVNKVNTAVRATHLPSGLSVSVSNERSQLRNKKEAKRKLQMLLANKAKEDLKDHVKDRWKNHTDIERGNPVRVFSGSNFKAKKANKTFKKKRQQLKKEMRDWAE